MSDKAVVCPHCGTRQRDRDPVVPPKRAPYRDPDGPEPGPVPERPSSQMKISPEEAAALFATSATPARARGPMALFIPRAGASPFARSLEWLLTLVSLPMLVAGLAPLVMRRRSARALRSGSELTLTLAALGLGGLMLFFTLGALGWSELTTYSALGLCGGALVGRLVLRMRTT